MRQKLPVDPDALQKEVNSKYREVQHRSLDRLSQYQSLITRRKSYTERRLFLS